MILLKNDVLRRRLRVGVEPALPLPLVHSQLNWSQVCSLIHHKTNFAKEWSPLDEVPEQLYLVAVSSSSALSRAAYASLSRTAMHPWCSRPGIVFVLC